MSDTTEDETREDEAPEPGAPFRVRDVFAFRRPVKPGADEETEPEADEKLPAPPEPTEPPTIPAQAATPAARVGRAARADGHQVPNWWDPEKDITAAKPCEHPNPRMARLGSTDTFYPSWCPACETALHGDVPGYKPPARLPTPTKACAHPDPHAVRSRPNNQLVAFWCADCETQLPVPDDYDELDDVAKEDDDGGEDNEDGETVDQVPPAVRRRWGVKGSGKKEYKRPVYGKDAAGQKKALFDVLTGMPRKTRHLLYNGSALGAGWYLGIPQFFTAETAYLVATYDSWTAFYVVIWYGVALGIAVFDYRTRNWFPLIAWATRIPLVSMIIGVPLYGTPAA